jgi:hypothetical protein
MPIIPPTPVANQIGPSGQKPYVNERNFGQMVGEILNWNPHASATMVQNWVNHIVRKIYDRRLWYGLMVKGQIVSPGFITGGSLQLSNGSPNVVGTGTNFAPGMIGMSLRVGYNNPVYNIIAVADSTHLTLELPWGSNDFSAVGYFITQYYYSIPNIKFIFDAINLQLQRRMWTNLTQATLNSRDPSRQQIMYSWGLASMPPDPSGNFQFELYPASMIQQAFPYLAYIQPPNLVNDSDVLPPGIRSDIVIAHGISDCLLYRPKENSYYDPATAIAISRTKMAEFERELMSMEQNDEALYRQDIVHRWEQMPLAEPGDAFWDILHPIARSGYIEGGGWED